MELPEPRDQRQEFAVWVKALDEFSVGAIGKPCSEGFEHELLYAGFSSGKTASEFLRDPATLKQWDSQPKQEGNQKHQAQNLPRGSNGSSGVGALAVIVGAGITGYFAFFYDVSVEAPMVGRIANLSLMSNRMIGVVVGVGLILLGGLIATRNRGSSDAKPAEDERFPDWHPFLRACATGDLALVQALCRTIDDTRLTAEGGFRAVHIAAHYDQPLVLSYLLDIGADIDDRTPDGRSPLDIAVRSRARNCEALLRSRGATD